MSAPPTSPPPPAADPPRSSEGDGSSVASASTGMLYLFCATFGFVALRFLLTPVRIKVLTSLLEKSQYGTLTLVSLTVSCLAVIFSFGSLEFMRSKCPGKPEAYQYGVLRTVTFLFVGLLAAFALPGALVLRSWRPQKLDLDGGDYLIAAALTVLTLHIVQRVYFLLGQRKYIYARLTQLLYADAWVLPILPFWVVGALSVRTVLWVWLGWLLLTTVITHSWVGFGKLWTLRPETVRVREVIVFGVPLLPMILGDWLFQIQDRYVLLWLKDKAAVANYSLCVSLAMVGFMVGASLMDIFSTEFFKLRNEAPGGDLHSLAADPRLRGVFRLMVGYALVVTLPAAAALGQVGEAIIRVLSHPRYLDVVPILGWTAPIPVLFVLYYVFGRVLLALDRGLFLGIATLAAGGLNLLLNVLLVPALAERGTALATVVSLTALGLAIARAIDLPRWLRFADLRPLRLVALYALCALGLHGLQAGLAGYPLLVLAAGAFWCLAVPVALGLLRREDLSELRAAMARG